MGEIGEVLPALFELLLLLLLLLVALVVLLLLLGESAEGVSNALRVAKQYPRGVCLLDDKFQTY